jgi:FtsH-binding integral membrane protein
VPFLNDEVRVAIVSSPGIVLIAAILGLILSCCLACVQSLARTVPMNYVLIFAFTACEAYTVAYICAVVNDSFLVVQAAFMTASLVLGLTCYAWTTKTDFTVYGGFLSSIGAVFLIFALFSVFFGPTLRLIYCVLGLAFFSVYLVYDTQLIIGGEDKYADIENDDYILAAMILYLDIINIFIYILQLLTSNKD